MSEIRLSRSDIIKWIAAFILAILPLLFPEQGIYTHAMKYFLAITILGLSMAAFEIVPVFVIAMIMPILWISFGVADVNVVMSPWIGTTVLMIIGALFLGASLADCGLLERIAYYLMCLVRGNFFALLVSIMIVGVLLNILTSGNGYPIMAPLAAWACYYFRWYAEKNWCSCSWSGYAWYMHITFLHLFCWFLGCN